jgi:branched-chain amino acid transport system permease protein
MGKSSAHFFLWCAVAALLALMPVALRGDRGLALISQICIAAVACLSFNILFGEGGMLSFGHAVYSGMGAYLAIHAMNAIAAGALWLPILAVPLVGGLAGLTCALLFGYVSTRRPGTVFAMITLATAELFALASQVFSGYFGGESGVIANRAGNWGDWGIDLSSPRNVYYLIASYSFFCTLAMFAFTRTPLGRMLNAVRDNSQRVAFLGYNPRQVRYRAFVVAGFFAGIAGGLEALNFELVNPEVLAPSRSAAYVLFVYLGGSEMFVGPILGGIALVLGTVLLSELTRAWLLYLGMAFILVVLFVPGGLAGLPRVVWRFLRSSQFHQFWPIYLGEVAGLLMALAALMGLIEMLYHRQLAAVVGPMVQLAGVEINTGRASYWLGLAALFILGFGTFAAARSLVAVRSARQLVPLQDGVGQTKGAV